MAPDRISLAEAEYWSTSTTTRPSWKSPSRGARYVWLGVFGPLVYTIISPLSRKMRCNLLGGVQISSAISLKVDDEIFHSLFFNLSKSFRKFPGGLFGKARYAYISCCGVGHVACVDTVYGYVGAGDGKINKPGHIPDALP